MNMLIIIYLNEDDMMILKLMIQVNFTFFTCTLHRLCPLKYYLNRTLSYHRNRTVNNKVEVVLHSLHRAHYLFRDQYMMMMIMMMMRMMMMMKRRIFLESVCL